MPDVLVVNASPLIFLGNAGRIDLLQAVGAGRVVVPQAVFDEVTGTTHADRAARALVGAHWIETGPRVAVSATVVEWDLGSGESEVIATALGIAGARAVIDDLSGRKCARAMGIDVMGTLGLVIAAHRRGHIEHPRQVLLDLRAAGMWVSDAIINRALRLGGLES